MSKTHFIRRIYLAHTSPLSARTSTTFRLAHCRLGLERAWREAEGGERGGENVYLNPYSHIDQPSVEVRLARDNNDPDLATRHVSVLLSFLLSIRRGS